MHAEPRAHPPPEPPAANPVDEDDAVAPPAEPVEPAFVEPLPDDDDVTASSQAARRKNPMIEAR
jgi:hypothetical protein